MSIDLDQLPAWVVGFLWPFVRIGAMLSVAPLIGARTVPMRVRLMLALALTGILAPLTGPAPAIDPVSLAGTLVVANQVLIGLTMGLTLQVAFAALLLAGQFIAASMGLGLASAIDPQNGIQVPVIGQLYFLLGALIFLALDGHLMIVELLALSFETLPIAAVGLAPEAFKGLAIWGGVMFSEGLRLALPVLSVILLTNLALGVATRAAPQLNVFALGFAVMIILGFVAMLFSLPSLSPFFASLLTRSFDKLTLLVAG